VSGRAAELARALGAILTGQNQWQARCPFHDDTSPSLSISNGEDGRVLVHCHAGCEDVFRRLVDDGLLPCRSSSGSESQPEARYPYADASGTLVYEMLRFPGKKFQARRPTNDGAWVYDVPEKIRIPYRLPQVLQAAADALVFVVEGEKDADTLAAHDYVVTTNPFGAGKWRPQYNQHFVGRHVVIVPDNDNRGRTHTEQIRQQLEPVAASVRVMSLAGVVAEKGDVSDLIEAHGIEALARLIDQLPAPEHRTRPYLTIADLALLPPRSWLVEDLVPQGAVALLYGDSGVGKTFIAIDACVRIAASEPVFGRPVKSGLVLYVSLEGQSGLHDRIRGVCQEIGVINADRLPLVVRTRSLNLLSADSIGDLIPAVRVAETHRQISVALVVVDTLSRAMPGADENGADMSRAVQGLTRIQHETGATVLAIHHTGKNGDRGPRGHTSLRAGVDTELFISRQTSARALTVTKQRDGADQIAIPFQLVAVSLSMEGEEQASTQTLVVRSAPADDSQARPGLKSATQRHLRALKEVLRTRGRLPDSEEADAAQVPQGARVVSRNEWLEACREAKISRGNEDAARKALSRASQELRQVGVLGEAADLVWIGK
jgi:AAA domain